MIRRSKVFDGKPKRFEQSDLVGRAPAFGLLQKQLPDFTNDVIIADCSFLPGNEEIARFIQR
jgi:hypothetical protein